MQCSREDLYNLMTHCHLSENAQPAPRVLSLLNFPSFGPPAALRYASPSVLLYAATIFLSAFLLFQVQPLIAKFILPWFGGAAAVWSAALLFFQLVLLAGYFYAHLLIWVLKPTQQFVLHLTLLAASLATLPILPAPHWKPTSGTD